MNKLLERAVAEAASLPDGQQEAVAACLLDEVRRYASREGRWAQVADRLARLNALEGRSEEFRRHVREFRDGFGMGEPGALAG